MTKQILTFSLFSLLLIACSEPEISKKETIEDINKGRTEFYLRKIIPEDGILPKNIRAKELAFAKTLPQAKPFNENRSDDFWTLRGPINIGGRTRAIAQDVTNPKVLLGGGISGGLFRSTDKGQSWSRVISIASHQGVSCLSQDTRAGKENVWYYGSGEATGNSASAYSAHYGGNGIYKSTDGGITWVNIESTSNESPETLNIGFDQVYNIATDPLVSDKDVVYAASYGGIQKSTDGGSTWETTLSSSGGISTPTYSDIELAENGLKYAFISGEGSPSSAGVYISNDGDSWENITPSFAGSFHRMILEAEPNNGNILYVFGETIGEGNKYESSHGDVAYVSLWKYNHADKSWRDLSQRLPDKEYLFDGISSQTGYNLVIEVSPHNNNHVIVGGNNLYRFTNGVGSEKSTLIGGYREKAEHDDPYRYPNHHPDNHAIIFDAENENGMISAHDGGISYTDDYTANEVEWEFLTTGYYTTQSHTIAINQNSTDDIIITGLQDNGSLFTESDNPQDDWVISLYGDGAYSGISDDSKTFYCSWQSGSVFKMKLDKDGYELNKYKIKPADANVELFINPFILDPNDDNIMYYIAGRRLFRCPDLSVFPDDEMNNSNDVHYGWDVFSDSVTSQTGFILTALAASKGDDRRLYVGTGLKRVYKIDNPHTGDPEFKEVSEGLPNGYVSDIAIDPSDPDKFAVVYSNYKLKSIFYSEDGGESYMNVSGNLEEKENGRGAGPSCRSIRILNGKDGGKIYFVATSTGLYTTNQLIEDSTIWRQVALDEIGYSVIEKMTSRNTDNLVALGTHGNGVYSAKVNYYYQVNNIEDAIKNEQKLVIYPNPTSGVISVENQEIGTDLFVFDHLGRKIMEKKSNHKLVQIDLSDYSAGTYYLSTNQDGSSSQIIIKQ